MDSIEYQIGPVETYGTMVAIIPITNMYGGVTLVIEQNNKFSHMNIKVNVITLVNAPSQK